MTTLTIHNSSR